MASEGYVCIDYDTLYCFAEIKLNDAAKVKEVSCSIPVRKSTSVIMNGAPLEAKLYEIRGDKHYFNKDMQFSEWMYLTHDDGSFTDIVFPVRRETSTSQVITNPVTVYLKKGFSGVPKLLNGIRATADIPSIVHDGTTRTMTQKLTVTHISGELDVNFQMIFLNDAELTTLNIRQQVLHELQEFVVDYGICGCSFKKEDSLGTMVEMSFKPTQFLTKLTIYTIDDVALTSYVIRDLKDTKKVDGGIVRTLTPDLLKTDGCFVLNDTFYKTTTGRVNQPIENDSRFSTYNDSSATWTSYSKHGEITFAAEYTINLVDENEKEFNLRNVGNWVNTESVTFLINDKEVLPQLKLKDKEIGKDLKLTVKFDDCEKTCTIRFQVDGNTRMSVLIDGEEDFASVYTRRASFYNNATGDNFVHLWSHGRFIANIGEPIHAYGTTVVLGKDGVCQPGLTKYPGHRLHQRQDCQVRQDHEVQCRAPERG